MVPVSCYAFGDAEKQIVYENIKYYRTQNLSKMYPTNYKPTVTVTKILG